MLSIFSILNCECKYHLYLKKKRISGAEQLLVATNLLFQISLVEFLSDCTIDPNQDTRNKKDNSSKEVKIAVLLGAAYSLKYQKSVHVHKNHVRK